MQKQASGYLIVLCVLIVAVGCALEVTQAWSYGLPLLFSGAAGLVVALLWRSPRLRRPAVLGFLVPAAVPFSFGIFVMTQQLAYYDSLRTGEAACGMGMLGAWFMIRIAAPICGAIGLVVVAIVSAVDWVASNHKHPPAPPAA